MRPNVLLSTLNTCCYPHQRGHTEHHIEHKHQSTPYRLHSPLQCLLCTVPLYQLCVALSDPYLSHVESLSDGHIHDESCDECAGYGEQYEILLERQ